MATLATICGSILVLILAASTMSAFGMPPNVSIGLTMFGGCVAGLLGMSIRLALEDKLRGHHHH